MNPRQSVSAAFAQVIGREPSPDELAQALQGLAGGTAIGSIRSALAGSSAASAALVQLYADVVGRAITPAEAVAQQAMLAAGGSLQALRSYFATTPEAANKLATLYADVTGRPITADELRADQAAIGAGNSLAGLRAYMADTDEAADKLRALYADVTGRAITADELRGAQAAIGDGAGTLAGLRTYMAGTDEAADKLRALYADVTGRAITADELHGAQTVIGSGANTLAGLRAYMAGTDEAANKLRALYTDVTGRAITADELRGAQNAIGSGANSLAGLRTYMAGTDEAADKLRALYMNELGRPITAAELRGGEQVIAGGSSLSSIRDILAVSNEATRALASQFQSALGAGTGPSAADLAAARAAIASGETLAQAIAGTPGVSAVIADGYRALLGNDPSAADLVAARGSIAAALGTTPVSDHPAAIDAGGIVAAVARNGPTFASDVSAAFQAALGRAPTAIELAADRSELQAGFTVAAVRSQIAQLAGGTPPVSAWAGAPRAVPDGPSFIYGLFNNDALVASKNTVAVGLGIRPDEVAGNPIAPDTVLVGGGASATTGFDPATDFFQIAGPRNTGFADLSFTQKATASGQIYTEVAVGGHATLTVFAPEASLTAANFRFA
ncbi:MAG: hypothetical protein INR65_08430 [Gluconacetobacter diazotrophicus]|nr:hypothetical protein [Gluconacetobacter diazotrophicus]